jgi:hypothetical protein
MVSVASILMRIGGLQQEKRTGNVGLCALNQAPDAITVGTRQIRFAFYKSLPLEDASRRVRRASSQFRQTFRIPRVIPMKPVFFSLCLAGLFGLFGTSTASAFGPNGGAGQGGFGFPFVPFGFYQPYGAHYGTSLRTPPYFATNPPVYYGARYARPYGLSPFAAPPMMDAPADYRGRLAEQFVRPPVNNPYLSEECGSGCAQSNRVNEFQVAGEAAAPLKKMGTIQLNPFVDSEANQVAVR